MKEQQENGQPNMLVLNYLYTIFYTQKKEMANPALYTLSFVVIITLLIGIFMNYVSPPTIYRFRDTWGTDFSRKGWDQGISTPVQKGKFVLESFSDATPQQVAVVKGVIEETNENPANVSSSSLLLNPPLSEKNTKGNLTAKSCYDTDFYRHTDKVGNYIQRTNNFRHGSPESCSSPLTELVNSFYST
jgi:hypothetical protein